MKSKKEDQKKSPEIRERNYESVEIINSLYPYVELVIKFIKDIWIANLSVKAGNAVNLDNDNEDPERK